MENIFAAVILIFLLLFGGLTLSSAYISAQQIITDSWQAMYTRSEAHDQTRITPEQIRILEAGTILEVTIRNDGARKLSDFRSWDVFAEFYDASNVPEYYTGRLHYTANAPSTGQWSVQGIYQNADATLEERYEPGILNTSEFIVLRLAVAPAVGIGQTAHVTVSTANGVSTAIMGTRNMPPILQLNTGIKVAANGSTPITSAALLAADTDNTPAELAYAIAATPSFGAVTPDGFTQAAINDGAVVYTHSGGTDADSFNVTLTDGTEQIGPYTVNVTVNTPLALATNAGLTLPAGGTATITNALLRALDTDEDDPPSDLFYTLVQFPSNGTLSLGSSFSQTQIDNNLLTYTHTGTDADLFTFVVSDGYDVIGAYTFLITLVS